MMTLFFSSAPKSDMLMGFLQVDLPSQELILGGVIIGILLGVPLLTFVLSGQHRWLAVLALNAFYIVAYVIGGWLTAFAAVFASVLAILVTAALFRHAFSKSTWEAFLYEIALAFGRTKDLQMIEDGKTVLPKKGEPFLGPRRIVVKPNNAIILECGSQQTRVSGPAVITTQPFEYVKRILDLRPRQERLVFGRAVTIDQLAVDMAIDVIYCIDIPDAMRLGKSPFGDQEKTVIREIDLRLPQWEQATHGVIESFVRKYAGSRGMLEMLQSDIADDFEEKIRDRSDKRCSKAWHVRINSVVLQRVHPVSEVAQYMNDRAKAAAQRDALQLMADGYKQAEALGMKPDASQQEVFRHTLEQIAKDSSTELFIQK